VMFTETDRPQEAEKLLHEAMVEIEPLALRRSQYTLMGAFLAGLNANLGNSLFSQERFVEAHDAYVRAQNIRRQSYQTHTDAPGPTRDMIDLLVFCPDKSVRDPATAAGIARAALQRTPRIQYLW